MMFDKLKNAFRLLPIVVSASVMTFFLSMYRLFSGALNIRDLSYIVAFFAVLLFMAIMIRNLRAIKHPVHYVLEVCNVLGEEDDANFRKEFKNYDVAVSYMQMYRSMYPHYKFVLTSIGENSKKTVHKRLE